MRRQAGGLQNGSHTPRAGPVGAKSTKEKAKLARISPPIFISHEGRTWGDGSRWVKRLKW